MLINAYIPTSGMIDTMFAPVNITFAVKENEIRLHISKEAYDEKVGVG